MAVTNESSAQFSNVSANPPARNAPSEWHGRMRFMRFDFTQGAAAGDATSTLKLVKLPAGTVRIFPELSRVIFSAFGASRTLDIGLAAHTSLAGATVAIQVDVITDGLDVSSAGSSLLGTGTNASDDLVASSRDGVTVVATVNVSTIPAAATVDGWIVYGID